MLELTPVTSTSTMVYCSVEEKKKANRLFHLKAPTAVYYKQTKKIGYHWLISPVTAKRLRLV